MKVTFILPNIELNGGVKAVFILSEFLQKFGHDVEIIYPLLPYTGGRKYWQVKHQLARVKFMIQRFFQPVKPTWYDLKTPIKRVFTINDSTVSDSDVVVATWWETAYSVDKLSERKGCKYYFAQHYEVWGGPKEDVDKSYQLGLKVIVNSNWLYDILNDELDVKPEKLILHAPDHSQFYLEDVEKDKDNITILMPYRKTQDDWKGIDEGLYAFEKAREKNPDIKLVTFGPEDEADMPEYIKAHQNPTNDELRKLYNQADIFLFPSKLEGFGMPPMEAMACKCAVCVTDVGAVREYTNNGETALVSPPRDKEKLAENLTKLVSDEKLRTNLAELGYDKIQKYQWENQARILEKIFEKTIRS